MQLTHLFTRKSLENGQVVHCYVFHIQLYEYASVRSLEIDLLDERGSLLRKCSAELPLMIQTEGQFIQIDDFSTRRAYQYRYMARVGWLKKRKQIVQPMEGRYQDLASSG